MIVFNGAKFVETLTPSSEFAPLSADVVVFVASWESRASYIAKNVQICASKAILLSFENDDLTSSQIDDFIDVLKRMFTAVEHRRIPAAINHRQWGGELERLASDLTLGGKAQSVAIDYTCLPKAISQTLFRAFIRKGSFPKMSWVYSLGKYDDAFNNLSFSQGAKDFFPIRHTPGDGGMSHRRAAVVGPGSDESLVVEFLERYNFDRVIILSAHSKNSPGLQPGMDRLKDRLIKEGRVFEDDFLVCDASSVIKAIDVMYGVVSELGPDTSVDIFTTGPKSHAIAACVVAEKFKTVRLMGRVAEKYAQYEVPAEGTISMVQVVDYKNPSTRLVL